MYITSTVQHSHDFLNIWANVSTQAALALLVAPAGFSRGPYALVVAPPASIMDSLLLSCAPLPVAFSECFLHSRCKSR
jgi:hypothetical protein